MRDNSANRTYNITTNGTTVIPGKWLLEAIVINTKGASSNTMAIYDSNETIGANVLYIKGTIDTTVVPGVFNYGIPMFNGIYIVTATGTAPNVTLVYKELI